MPEVAEDDSTARNARERAVTVTSGETRLDGDLTVPDRARGVVLFAHGSGSGRHSTRNRHVATGMVEAGFATLLMDLLTLDEERIDQQTRQLRFDIPLLASRLTGAVDWLSAHRATSGLPVVVFGASTGAAAALIAAAERPERVRGVISRGGRADLAGASLGAVVAPVLLIVGGEDPVVLELNERATRALPDAEVRIVPGAGHLFEEPGALDAVVRLAIDALNAWIPADHPADGGREPR